MYTFKPYLDLALQFCLLQHRRNAKYAATNFVISTCTLHDSISALIRQFSGEENATRTEEIYLNSPILIQCSYA